jgi:hypothetical protein
MADTQKFDTSFPDFLSTLYPVAETGGVPVMRNTMEIRDRALLQKVEYVVAETGSGFHPIGCDPDRADVRPKAGPTAAQSAVFGPLPELGRRGEAIRNAEGRRASIRSAKPDRNLLA